MQVSLRTKRPKRSGLAAVAASIALILAGCSSGSGASSDSSASAGDSAESVTLRWAYVLAPNSPFDKGAQEVKQIVEEKTAGRVKIEIFPSGQLGSDAETAEATMDGTIDINSGGLPYARMPQLQVHVAPFVFRDAEHLHRVLNGDVARKLLWDPMKAEVGLDFLDGWYFGTMYFFSNKQFTDASSSSGVKIRTPEQQNAIDMINAVGATPTPIAFPELYTAMQTGTVDAMFGPLPNNFGAKLNEVSDYVIEFGYPSVVSTVVNAATFETISAGDQQIIRDAMHEVAPTVTSDTKASEEKFLAQAKAEMEVLPSDVDSFRQAVQERFVPKYDDIFGPGVYEALYNDQVEG
jgi:tripartite ATP-independent transporter DctP family solute receptor